MHSGLQIFVVGSDSASIVVPVEGEPNKFVVTSGKKLFVVTWDGKSDTLSDVKILAEVTSPGAFNDGKCDPSGRLWTGKPLKLSMTFMCFIFYIFRDFGSSYCQFRGEKR